MIFHYPSLPLPDVRLELHQGELLRDLIKTCAANDIEYRILYDHGGPFRHTQAARWGSRRTAPPAQ